jgi:hypothetical protein
VTTTHHVHGTFSKGMLRDIPSWEVPEGYCWDAADWLFDVPGKARKRGGWTAPSATSRTAGADHMSGYKSGDLDASSGLLVVMGKGGVTIGTLDRTTGAISSGLSSGPDTFVAKPFQYQNVMMAPFVASGNTNTDQNLIYAYGGGRSSATGITSALVTANNNLVSSIAGPSFNSLHVGCFIVLYNTTSSTIYMGRIIAVPSISSVRVSPTPTVGFTANNGFAQTFFNAQTLVSYYNGQPSYSAKFGVAYQGRSVLANVTVTTLGTQAANGANRWPYRVWWSNEQADPLKTGIITTEDGDASLYPNFYGQYNYVDIPEVGPLGITGLAVAGEGDLIVFGANVTFRITGELSTETVLNPSFSFTVQQVSANVGCLEPRSIQYTRQGLVFAGKENLFLFDGSQMHPLLSGTNENYYQARIQAGDTVLGSAWLANQNHYYLSMSGADGGLLFNMDGLEMGRITNTAIMDSTRDPDDPTKVWV